jgi:O-antigen ligase
MGLLVLTVRYYVQTRQDVVYVTSLLMLAVAFQGVLSILQALFQVSLGLGFLGERDTVWVISYGGVSISRAGGTMGHANALANYIEVLFPLSLALLLARARGFLRWLSLVALVFALIGLFLTFSRAGWGASLIGIGVVLLLSGAFGVIRGSKVIAVGLFLSAALGIATLALWPTISQRVSVFGSNSWLVRTGTIQVATQMIREHPWLGVGINNYVQLAPDYVPWDMSPLFGQLNAHNLFYLITAETGFLGLAAFVLLLWTILTAGYKIARSKRDYLSPVVIGILGGLLSLVAHALFDWLFFYDPIYALFWFQVGILVAIRDIVRRERIARPQAAGASTTL